MNLHQFRFVHEAVRRKLNLTETARALATSQPGVSKAILELEEELGVDIFARHGRRLRGVTEPGVEVLKAIDVVLREVGNLKRIGEEFSKQEAGTLSIAATHAQACYVLPQPLALLRQRYPKVQVVLHQGSPRQVARMVADGTAEIGLAAEALADDDSLITLPHFEWQHVVVMPAGHALAAAQPLTLEQLAAQPLLTYHPSFAVGSRLEAAFAQRGLKPIVALQALDADVIKTYVRLGLGVGIVAEMAVGDASARDDDLVRRPAGHLFGHNVASVALRRGSYLREFVYTFAELLSERFPRALLRRAMATRDANEPPP